jgi:hypothetical protein
LSDTAPPSTWGRKESWQDHGQGAKLLPRPKLKRELAGLIVSLDGFKIKWKGVFRTMIEDDFAKTSKRWLERCKKLVV